VEESEPFQKIEPNLSLIYPSDRAEEDSHLNLRPYKTSFHHISVKNEDSMVKK